MDDTPAGRELRRNWQRQVILETQARRARCPAAVLSIHAPAPARGRCSWRCWRAAVPRLLRWSPQLSVP